MMKNTEATFTDLPVVEKLSRRVIPNINFSWCEESFQMKRNKKFQKDSSPE